MSRRRCDARRRPGRRPCAGLLTIFFDVDKNDVLWFCPVCDDQGRISGWEDTFWDNGNLLETTSTSNLLRNRGAALGSVLFNAFGNTSR